MRGFIRKLSVFLISVLLLITALPMSAFAAGKIDTDAGASLTICYTDGTKNISNAQFAIYKVADVDPYSAMTLTKAFEPYKSSVAGLSALDSQTKDSWFELASTLKGCVQRDKMTPTAAGKTDANGTLAFTDLGVGLYLVVGDMVKTSSYNYTATPFMVFLPDLNASENIWNYDAVVNTKFSKSSRPHSDTKTVSRKVLKIWKDDGNESARPKEITVQLLKNGDVCDTQTLNKANNWRYTWEKLDGDYEWTVTEKAVSGYETTVVQNGVTFTITNTKPGTVVPPVTQTKLPVQKQITGDTPDSASTFTFLLTAKDAACPMPKGSSGTTKEVSITGAGSTEFGELLFEKPGSYEYTVSEKNTGAEGYTYDSTVYTIAFEVAQVNGELAYTQTITDNSGNTAKKVVFSNTYKTPGNKTPGKTTPGDKTPGNKTPGKKLPQTRSLWWPVPVLLCLGLVMVIVGVVRRQRNDG